MPAIWNHESMLLAGAFCIASIEVVNTIIKSIRSETTRRVRLTNGLHVERELLFILDEILDATTWVGPATTDAGIRRSACDSDCVRHNLCERSVGGT